jgi:hypothetical protein
MLKSLEENSTTCSVTRCLKQIKLAHGRPPRSASRFARWRHRAAAVGKPERASHDADGADASTATKREGTFG